MPNIDISQLMRDVSIFKSQLGESELAMQANLGAQQSTDKQIADNQIQMGNLAVIMQDALLSGQRATQEASARAALQIGEDSQDSMGMQRERAARLLQAQAERRSAVEAINKKSSTSLLSDPVGYIYSLLTINEDIDKHNAAARTINTTQAEITETNTLLTKQVQNFKNTEVTITEASQAAAAEKLRLEAQSNALITARQSYAAQNQGITQLLGMKKEAIYAASTILDAEAKKISIETAQEQLALARASAERQLAKEQREEAAGKYVQENVIAGMKVLYPSNQEKWEVPNSPRMIALMSGRVPLDGELKRAFELGLVNTRLGQVDPNNPASPRILATSPNDLFETLQYNPTLSSGQQQVVSRMIELRNEAMQDPQFRLLDPKKDGEKAKEFINKFVREGIAQDAKRVSGPDNLFALPNPAYLIEKVPALQNTTLAQKIILPLAKAGVDINDPSSLYKATLDAVSKGEVKLNEVAVDLSVLYRHAQRINIEAKGFVSLGIAPKESYNVSIRNGLVSRVVDLADPTVVRRMISEDMSLIARKQLDEVFNSTGLEGMINRAKFTAPDLSFGPQITYPPQPGTPGYEMYGGNARKTGGQ